MIKLGISRFGPMYPIIIHVYIDNNYCICLSKVAVLHRKRLYIVLLEKKRNIVMHTYLLTFKPSVDIVYTYVFLLDPQSCRVSFPFSNKP